MDRDTARVRRPAPPRARHVPNGGSGRLLDAGPGGGKVLGIGSPVAERGGDSGARKSRTSCSPPRPADSHSRVGPKSPGEAPAGSSKRHLGSKDGRRACEHGRRPFLRAVPCALAGHRTAGSVGPGPRNSPDHVPGAREQGTDGGAAALDKEG